MNKKVLIFIIVLILLLIAGVAGYFYFESTAKTPTIEQGRKEFNPNKISEHIVVGPSTSFVNESVWFADKDGKFYRGIGGNITEFPMPAITHKPLRKIIWSPTTQDFIAVGTAQNSDSYIYYNSKNKQYFSIPKNVKSVDWMPDGIRVLWIWQSADLLAQQLVITNPDNTGYKSVASLPWTEFDIKVSPTGKEALLVSTKDSATNNIYLFDLDNGSYRTLVGTGKNLGVKWVNSNKFLYSQLSGTATNIHLFDITTNQDNDLNLESNTDKLVVDLAGKFAYIAVSQVFERGEKIVKIDLDSLQVSDEIESTNGIKIKQLLLGQKGLYFVSNEDGKLYELN